MITEDTKLYKEIRNRAEIYMEAIAKPHKKNSRFSEKEAKKAKEKMINNFANFGYILLTTLKNEFLKNEFLENGINDISVDIKDTKDNLARTDY